MKINKISVRNYKGISEFDYEPNKKITVLHGSNGAGKSTILSSIQYALCGSKQPCIKNGEDAMQVTVDLDGISFARAVNKGKNLLGLNGKIVTGKIFNEKVVQITDTEAIDDLKLITSSDILNNIDPMSFGKLLIKYIPEKVDFTKIKSFCEGLSTKEEDIFKNLLGKETDIEIDDVTIASDKAASLRREIKRKVTDMKQQLKMLSSVIPSKTKEMATDELNTLLSAEKEQIVYLALLKEFEQGLKNKERMENYVLQAEKEIQAIGEVSYDLQKYDTLKENILAITKKMSDEQLNLASFSKTANDMQVIIENLSTSVCPIHKDIVCSTDKTPLKDKLTAIVKENEESAERCKKILNDLSTELENAKKEEALSNKDKEKYIQKQSLEKQLERFKNELKETKFPEKPEEKEIVDYSSKIQKIKDEIRAIESYEKYQDLHKKIGEEEALVKIYDKISKLCCSGGIVVTKILENYLEYINDECMPYCKQIDPNMNILFKAGGGVSFEVKINDDKDYVAFTDLSSGEQVLVAFVITGMLNSLLGLGISAIDNIDSLDMDGVDAIVRILKDDSLVESYDHIFISTTEHMDTMEHLKELDADFVEL